MAVCAAMLVAACSSTPKKHGDDASSRAAPGGDTKPATAAASARKGGGYYLDDGPGDNPPPNLELLPDAVPRIEKYASGANRPYNVFGVDYIPDLSGSPYRRRGVGSWYGRKFHGQRTSSGEIYDMYAMTAAHPTLPIPCYALVTNVQNGRSVIVRVNDRGPFLHERVMDLSYAAAYKLGTMSSGSGLIEVEMLRPADIAAGRIPTTTTGLLALASTANPRVAAVPALTAAPAAKSDMAPLEPSLTIETLTASALASPGASGPAPTPDLVSRPDRQPAPSLPEIATASGFYLQLGAFRGREGAESFASHVAREIDPVLASRMQVSNGNGLYRVRVGPYLKRSEADVAAASIRSAVTQPVLVVPDGGLR